MKPDPKLTAIMWLLRQTVYDSWSNISCSSIRFSSLQRRSKYCFHKTLHQRRLHMCHVCLVFFSASAGRDKWLPRSFILTLTLHPIYQNCAATYTSYCEQNFACLLPAIFHLLLWHFCSGWRHSSLATTLYTCSIKWYLPSAGNDTQDQLGRYILQLKRFETINDKSRCRKRHQFCRIRISCLSADSKKENVKEHFSK